MTILRGIAQPADYLLTHMLLAYWRKLLTSGLLFDSHPEEVVLVGFGIAVKGFELDLDRPLGHAVDDLKGGDEGLVAVFLVGVDLGRTYVFAIDPDRHADLLFTGVTIPGPCSRDDERPAPALVVGALFGQRAVRVDNLFGAKLALWLGLCLFLGRVGLAHGGYRGYNQPCCGHQHRQSNEQHRLRCQHSAEWVAFHVFPFSLPIGLRAHPEPLPANDLLPSLLLGSHPLS